MKEKRKIVEHKPDAVKHKKKVVPSGAAPLHTRHPAKPSPVKHEPVAKPEPVIVKPPPVKKAPADVPPESKTAQPIIKLVETEEKDIRALRAAEINYLHKEMPAETTPISGKIINVKQAPPHINIPLKKTFFLRDRVMRPAPPTIKAQPKVPQERKITVQPPVRVKDISEKIGIKANQIIQKLMQHNIMATINDTLSEDALILVGLEFDYEIEISIPKDITAKSAMSTIMDRKEDLVARPPVVVVMGHVDHGKTSLLDKIRNTKVAAGEAGLITQHIGASEVEFNHKKIVFLDTPGHEAFTLMRARGANITDIVVLVVAADDGVMPQTEEAIKHARLGNVPIIVAINKVDKPGINLHKVKQQLSSLELVPEEWGGKIIFCEVSALTGQGIDHILEMILLQTEVMELRANPKRKALGIVIESKLTDNYGPVATCLVQNGTLRIGDAVTCGSAYGKVRAMFSSLNRPINEAPPSTPVQITGLSELTDSGDKFYKVDNIHVAKELAQAHAAKKKTGAAMTAAHSTLENLFSRIEERKIKEVRLILKADVHGSLEVLPPMLEGLSTAEVKVKIASKAIGQINESDVLLADATDAIIIGFNVAAEDKAMALAKQHGIEIKTYSIIYHIVEELRLAMEGLLEPELVEVPLGKLVVKNIFKISSIGNIAGCQVTSGKIERSSMIRVRRGKDVIHTGKLSSLKRIKDDVREVTEGFECGLKVDGFNDISVGDSVESYHIEKRLKKLTAKPAVQDKNQ